MKQITKILPGILLVGLVTMLSCNKENPYETVIPDSQVNFVGSFNQTYLVNTPTVAAYSVIVGSTDVINEDRVVTINISSPTGAAQGTQYTVGATTVTIPAGEARATLSLQGIYNAYTSGRKDTLVLDIVSSDKVKTGTLRPQIKLYMRGPCFEGEMVLNEMRGSYPRTNEDLGGSAYGPYTTTISAVSSTGPTTGTVTVTNIFDFGWNPIQVQLDWTNPLAVVATVPQQSGIGNAGTLSSAYNGQDISVRPFAGQPGTYSYCNKTLALKMQLGVTGLGWFPQLYQVNMAR